MKKIISSLLLGSFTILGVLTVYASTTGDFTVQYWNGSSYTNTDLTPYPTEDGFVMFDYMTGGYKIQRAPGYLHVNEINGMTAQLSNMQNDINDRAYASHQHNIIDTIGLATVLANATSSIATNASAISSIQSSLASATSTLVALQSQVTTMASSTPTITNGVTRTIETLTTATGTRLSTTKTSNVMYSVNIVTTASIGGSAAGEILLETSPTNTSTSTWTVVNRVKNSQTISLAVALNSVQDITYSLMGNVPSGYYVRLRSINVSGTPTYTFVTGQEMQF